MSCGRINETMSKTKPHSARNKSQPGALTRAPQSLGCAVQAAAAGRWPVAEFCAGKGIWKAAREASAEGDRASRWELREHSQRPEGGGVPVRPARPRLRAYRDRLSASGSHSHALN